MDGMSIPSLLLYSVGQSSHSKPSFKRRGNKPQLSWEDVKEVAPSLIHYSDLGT